ncbi:MAG: beta-N-acetylhexosaminidase [Ruminococcaceae bacterium]|nr:beta-N-acetylhexosaminidase [Oscillospiraceae bacterium]
MELKFLNCENLLFGIKEVSEELGFNVTDSSEAITVNAIESNENISALDFKNNTATITYGGGKPRFYRALAKLVAWIKDGKNEGNSTENPIFDNNGTMIDASRNAVMNVDTVKFVMRKMALMGMNTFMLYTEDTYEIEGRPYFGYMRGKYTKEEIKELDAYALILGIELIPCIQVLGHMATHLHWAAATPYKDTERVMLVGAEETYRLIDDIFKTVSECFTTKKVHMGMDETYDLGTGRYLDINGFRERHEIFLEHLGKVAEIAKSHGLEPMMWSDMFFRLAGKDLQNYHDYDTRVELPDYICDYVPKGVRQVFWDYYKDYESFYAENIEKHKKLGDGTVFAGGVWAWSGYSIHFSRSLANTRPALYACKHKGIKDVVATVWHNGSEAQLITSLAGLAWYADFGYTGEFDIESIKACFTRACGDFYIDIMRTEEIEYPHGGIYGISRALMFNDPLTGLVDKHIEEQGVEGSYYVKLSESYKKLGKNSGIFEPAFDVIRAYSSLMENKADFGVRLIKAYKENDRAALQSLLEECDVIISKFQAFIDAYRKAWMTYNKPFGFEVHDIRHGGNIARFITAKSRINDYLSGKSEKIEELEEERLYLDCRAYTEDENKFSGTFIWTGYKKIATVNIL